MKKHPLQPLLGQCFVQRKISVFVIAEYGEAQMGQVNSDLMGTTRFKFSVEQALWTDTTFKPENGDCVIALGVDIDPALPGSGDIFL